MKTIDASEIITLINRKAKEEDTNFNRYKELNPDDRSGSREHEHRIINSIYAELIYEIVHAYK